MSRFTRKKQTDLADFFGMSKQVMSNKMARGSLSAKDLTRMAEFVGCKVGFLLPDGQHIFLEAEAEKKARTHENVRACGSIATFLTCYVSARRCEFLSVFLGLAPGL